jgi:hypothetical protein
VATPKVFDRVKDTTTTTSTGTITLANSAPTGYRTFGSVLSNGDTCTYAIAGQTSSEWEVGIGTYSTTGPTLARTTVLASSNSNAAVAFSAGTKDVFMTVPADFLARLAGLTYDQTAGSLTSTGFIKAPSVFFGVVPSYVSSPQAPVDSRWNPSSMTVGQACVKAIIGPAAQNTSNPALNDYVGFYSEVLADANRTRTWGINTLCITDASVESEVIAAEFDISNYKANAPDPGTANHKLGCYVAAGGSFMNSAAFVCWAAGNSTAWKHGLWFMGVGGAVSGSTLIKAGSNCSVTYGIDFSGATMTGGAMLLPNGSGIAARNAANNADVPLISLDTSNNVVLGGTGSARLLYTDSQTSGSSFAITVTQTAANVGDTSDAAIKADFTISAATATNELILRGYWYVFTNNLTGGGIVQNARCINVTGVSNAGTVTDVMDGLFLEFPVRSGAVNTYRAIRVHEVFGTNSAGLSVDQLVNSVNTTYCLLGTATIPSGNFSIYSSVAAPSWFGHRLHLGPGNSAGTYGLHQLGGSHRLQALSTPGAPTLSVLGTTGAVQYTYYVVAEDTAGNKTLAGTGTSTSTANATLGTSSSVRVTWSAVTGAVKYYILRSAGAGAAASNTLISNMGTWAADGVHAITVNSGGNYAGTPTVVITPTSTGGTGAAATAVMSGTAIARVVITNPGSGYQTDPTISFSGGTPTTQATATASLSTLQADDTSNTATGSITLPTRNATADSTVDGQVSAGLTSTILSGVIFTGTATQTANTKNATTSLLSSTGTGTKTLAANTLTVGKTVRINVKGTVTLTTTSPCTLTFQATLGGSNICQSAAYTPGTATTTVYWEGYADITCRSTGSSGTVIGSGGVNISLTATTCANIGLTPISGTTVTVNTTGTLAVDFTVTQSNATNAQTLNVVTQTIELLG